MISIKRYLDTDAAEPSNQKTELDSLPTATIECYRAALLAIGKVAVQVSPGLGEDLDTNLRSLERRLSVGYTAESVKRTEEQVEVQLGEWGTRTAGHFKAQADEVKELLVALAKTAESVVSRDEGYSDKFSDLTHRLEKIANLNDLTQIRSSLVERVGELKTTVEQMTQDSRQLVAQLRAEVSTYETRLKSVERLALKDQLTKVANRRSLEERIQYNIENCHQFCVAMIDLNHFKNVNDTHGHTAGDDLLRQFATELQMNTRSGDLVGRWGGDEFIVILSCDLEAARVHIERLQKWVLGKYTIRGANEGSFAVQIDASIGAAEWQPGKTALQLIAEADAAMYIDKKLSRRKAS
jgi:diguanylate cyclase (GGDEF)-like protein